MGWTRLGPEIVQEFSDCARAPQDALRRLEPGQEEEDPQDRWVRTVLLPSLRRLRAAARG